ncbi:MAG: NEAT domain-containing protein [Lysinibacillus sp.]
MKKIISLLFAIVLAFAVLPFGQAGAELADGKYSLPYQVNKAGSTSASIANDYFIKPATFVKKNGTMYVQLTLKNSSQFVKFESTSGGNKVVGKDAGNDRRTVQFNISSLGKAQTVNVRIEIPEENYFHSYKIDFVWFEKNAKLIESYAKPAATKPATTTPAATTKPAVDTAKQEAAKKAEAEKKAAEAKAKEAAAKEKAEAKKAEEAKEAEEAKVAEEAKLKEDKAEASKEDEAKTDEEKEEDKVEATETKAEAVTATSAETSEKTTTSAEGETAEAGTSESKEKSGGAMGWIIGLAAVILIPTGGFLFFRKSKTA